MDERLRRLVARREAAAKEREEILAKRKAIVDLAEQESRDDLTEEEDTEFRALTEQVKAKDEELREFDERITELSEEIQRDKEVSEGALRVKRAISQVQVTSEARTYERGNRNSYLRDLALVATNMDGDGSSRARLERHAREVETDKEFRALDRVDTQGGYFVPPLWVMNEAIELARAGRATANLVTNLPLPPGTDSINIPKIATGTTTAVQDGDNTPISNTDATDTYVPAPVRTIAGEQDVAVQLLEQSPANFDEVIFRDLIASYATNVGTQVISGTGNNGQVKGILTAAGTISLTWTEAAPTVPKMYGQLADAIQRVHSTRFAPPQVIAMHPRRWGWITASLDTTNRPLVVPNSGGPMNAAGVLTNVDSQQVVGTMHGLPVVTDPNIPTSLGGGEAQQDVILILRSSDHYLYESSIRTRVVLSASGYSDTPAPPTTFGARTLTTTLQVYGYIAFTAERYPASTAKILGTGLEAPDFSYVDPGSGEGE